MTKKSKKLPIKCITEGRTNRGGVNPPPTKPKPDITIYMDNHLSRQNKNFITTTDSTDLDPFLKRVVLLNTNIKFISIKYNVVEEINRYNNLLSNNKVPKSIITLTTGDYVNFSSTCC